MNCSSCGSLLNPGAKYCTHCGAEVVQVEVIEPVYNNYQRPNQQVPLMQPQYGQQRTIPKCCVCGYVGPWKMEPFFTPLQIGLGIFFTLFCIFPGLAFFGTVALLKSNPNNRAKICAACGGRNLFTFLY